MNTKRQNGSCRSHHVIEKSWLTGTTQHLKTYKITKELKKQQRYAQFNREKATLLFIIVKVVNTKRQNGSCRSHHVIEKSWLTGTTQHLKKYKITKELKKQQINNVHSELNEKSIISSRCEIGKHNTTHRGMHNLKRPRKGNINCSS